MSDAHPGSLDNETMERFLVLKSGQGVGGRREGKGAINPGQLSVCSAPCLDGRVSNISRVAILQRSVSTDLSLLMTV